MFTLDGAMLAGIASIVTSLSNLIVTLRRRPGCGTRRRQPRPGFPPVRHAHRRRPR